MMIFQPSSQLLLVYQRVLDPLVSLVKNQKSTRARFGGPEVWSWDPVVAWRETLVPSGSNPPCFLTGSSEVAIYLSNLSFWGGVSCPISDRLQGALF